jgi:hypothetical protein
MKAFTEQQPPKIGMPLPVHHDAFSSDAVIDAMQAHLRLIEEEIVRLSNLATQTKDQNQQ